MDRLFIEAAIQYSTLIRDYDLKCEYLGHKSIIAIDAENKLIKFEKCTCHINNIDKYVDWLDDNIN